ncbi:hypothetical protein BC834DRAFT_787898, partial [Gloeopeniophorella convolvens]
DVQNTDRQDDRAAERLFSSSVLFYTLDPPDGSLPNIGLGIYSFVFGDLCDSVQSRKISHAIRIKMAFRAKFFKDIWRQFLRDGGYSEQRHFLSRDANEIIDIMVNSLLGLIYIHRDHLECKSPLLPWMHGSESTEHVFGMLRSLITDFSALDVLRMIPKLTIRLQSACKSMDREYGKTASGYSHTYFDSEDAPPDLFSVFPSDEEIRSLIHLAYEEALYLWSQLG